jgi:hypothetical protein
MLQSFRVNLKKHELEFVSNKICRTDKPINFGHFLKIQLIRKP